MNDQAALSLEFENVSKSFSPDKLVVHNLSFHVRKGEFFSFLGPSGCGKTTCLRLISGLEQPTSGTIRMARRIVNDIHPHKRNVHTVFQKYALFPHLSVFENVAFGLRMKRLPNHEVRTRVNQMLEMVHLIDHAKRSIQQLSGGEQQRVALVRALVNQPEILLLDEPLGALDLKLRQQMQQELAAIQKKLGTTFVFVTHDQGEALTLSDRVAIMNKGQIEQVGTPTEIYERPATSFVAEFVGTTNLFAGRVVDYLNGNGKRTLVVGTESHGQFFAKLDDTQNILRNGSPVQLVVRPEKIRIRVTAPAAPSHIGGTHLVAVEGSSALTASTQTQPAATINVLRGILIERIYEGSTTQIKLHVPERNLHLTALVANQTATKMPTLKLGERYYAVWDPADSILVAADLLT